MIKDYTIIPNPDFIRRKKIEERIKNNDGYCICSLIHDEDTECICKEFKEQDHSGWCNCGQYYKVLKMPKVCICGEFEKDELYNITYKIVQDFTLKGYNVMLPIIVQKNCQEQLSEEQKDYLEEITKSKIAEADLVYIINIGGYISPKTKEEITWALELGKKVQYLEELTS